MLKRHNSDCTAPIKYQTTPIQTVLLSLCPCAFSAFLMTPKTWQPLSICQTTSGNLMRRKKCSCQQQVMQVSLRAAPQLLLYTFVSVRSLTSSQSTPRLKCRHLCKNTTVFPQNPARLNTGDL